MKIFRAGRKFECTQEEWDAELEELISGLTAGDILNIPGVRELVEEELNNEIIEHVCERKPDEEDELDDDRDATSTVEFSERAPGRKAIERWAQAYDALNGAPEGDDDR